MILMEELKELLKKDETLVSGNKLLKNRIVELALKSDKDLIKLLLSNSKIKEHFFTEIDKVLLFDREKFMKFIDNKEFLPDSYTTFKNKIGLTFDKNYISESREVVLSWPYKDCILEGGQEEIEKRKEIFYNEILAPDEIDRLLDEKVFTNFKRIDANGEHKLTEIKTTDNIVINGNNLLVLHSLKKKFSGKVKLIYIDPPYNTGNDDFQYNDNFNHSSWLTFMKNRLEISKNLLREDGIIFVECDYNEEAYLKVLMDEIFKKENFINVVSVNSSTPSGVKTSHAEKKILKSQDFLLVYKKGDTHFNPQYKRKNKWDTHYMFFIEKDTFKLIRLEDKLKELGILNKDMSLSNFKIDDENHKKFYLENGDYIVRKSTHDNKRIKEICNNKFKDKIYTDENGNFYLNNDMLEPISKSFHDVLIGQKIYKDISNLLCDFWDDIDFQNTQNQGGVSLPAGKKPEQLIFRIINMSTQPGDIVLDFFLGSGTTCAVAHKMGRQYIGIEQLDYGSNDAIHRLKNVIAGDQSGISEAVNWHGGGSFIYAELKELNENFIHKIIKAETNQELLDIWDEMKDHAFLSYRISPQLFDKNIDCFKKLSLDEQKEILKKCLDLNNLYVNYSEIKDSQYKITEEDIELNNKFYGGL